MKRNINGYGYKGSSSGSYNRLPVAAEWQKTFPGGASVEVSVVDGREHDYREPYEVTVTTYNSLGDLEGSKAVSVHETKKEAIRAAEKYMENNPTGPFDGGVI